ncbi:MAG: VIT1/CCC1 transporter family protein, partial [Planctomycetota bacterium]
MLLFGLANLFGDAVSMGMGDYVSERSEREVAATERAEVRRMVDEAPAAAEAILAGRRVERRMTSADAAGLARGGGAAPEVLAD